MVENHLFESFFITPLTRQKLRTLDICGHPAIICNRRAIFSAKFGSSIACYGVLSRKEIDKNSVHFGLDIISLALHLAKRDGEVGRETGVFAPSFIRTQSQGSR